MKARPQLLMHTKPISDFPLKFPDVADLKISSVNGCIFGEINNKADEAQIKKLMSGLDAVEKLEFAAKMAHDVVFINQRIYGSKMPPYALN